MKGCNHKMKENGGKGYVNSGITRNNHTNEEELMINVVTRNQAKIF